VAGPAIASYRQSLDKSAFDIPGSVFDAARKREEQEWERIREQNQDGDGENVFQLHKELAEVMLRDCTIERDNGALDKVITKIDDVESRLKNVKVDDTSERANQNAQFARNFESMVALARLIAVGARNRDESRGAHYKPGFPERNDTDWMRTTLARYKGVGEAPQFIRAFDYACAGQTVHVTDEVDVSLVPPRERKYETAGAASAAAAPASGSAKGESHG
jgi:succinate dehydrogenase / fumarate reductase flavoprotein subunit